MKRSKALSEFLVVLRACAKNNNNYTLNLINDFVVSCSVSVPIFKDVDDGCNEHARSTRARSKRKQVALQKKRYFRHTRTHKRENDDLNQKIIKKL